jgi:hypothetical protein
LNCLRVRKRRKFPDGDDSSEAARPGIEKPLVASHKTPHDRTHAIGRDNSVGFDGPAVGEAQCDPITVFGKVHEPSAEAESFAVDVCAERPLKVRTMKSTIGRAETLPIGAAEADGMGRDPFAGPPVAVDKLGRLCRRRDDSIKKPETFELACAVGGQRDRCADFCEFARLLVDVSGKAALPKRKPKRKAADAGADNRNPRFATDHTHEAGM